jgi:hypothetical protein
MQDVDTTKKPVEIQQKLQDLSLTLPLLWRLQEEEELCYVVQLQHNEHTK